MKGGARAMGVDDSPFRRGIDDETYLVGLLFRGNYLEGAYREKIAVDGSDSTDAILSMLKEARGEARVVLLHGTTFGGFNLVDLRRLRSEAGIPAASFLERMPDREAVESALKAAGLGDRIGVARSNPEYRAFQTPVGPVYVAEVGLGDEGVRRLIERYCLESRLPYPVRAAHVVARLLRPLIS